MMKRERADRISEAMIAEAQSINRDPRMIHWVTRLSVFGSYLFAKPVLGDLDIAFEIAAGWDRNSDANYEVLQDQFRRNVPPPRLSRSQFHGAPVLAGARFIAAPSCRSRTAPDIACLQELNAPGDRFPEQALADLGYDCIWHGQGSWNGVAILSRVGKPVETRRGLPGDHDDSHSRYIEAAVNGILIARLSDRSCSCNLFRRRRLSRYA